MKLNELVNGVIDCKSIIAYESKIQFYSSKYYSLIFITNNKIQLYIDTKPFILLKGEYIIVPQYAECNYFSEESDSELFVIQFVSENDRIHNFFNIIFSSNKEQLSILKKVLIEIQYSIESERKSSKDILVDIADELMVNNLNQFFLEGERLFIFNKNIESGYITSDPQNYWERYNAKNRHYMEILKDSDKKKAKDSNILSAKAEEIAEYISEHCNENIKLEDIEKHFSFSKAYICRIFKRRFSQTILEYQTELKMEQAAKMLLEDKYSITQISDMLNFSTVHYFSSCFKKNFGVSPSQYFKLKQNSKN